MAEKSKKKEEFKILASKQQNGAIVCETEFDQNRLRTLPIGTPLKITVIKDPRNYAHHKKFFIWLAINLTLSSPHTYYLNAIFFVSFVYILYGISKVGAKEIDTEYAFNYIKETYSLDEDKIRELERRFITHLKEVENPEKS